MDGSDRMSVGNPTIDLASIKCDVRMSCYGWRVHTCVCRTHVWHVSIAC